MATYAWAKAVSGAFETKTDWSPYPGPPGSGDNALLTVTGAAYTVITTQTDTVNSLQTASNATLSIAGNQTFQMTNGTESTAFPTGANAGQILVGNNCVLAMGGVFNNTSKLATGGLVLDGTANATELRVLASGLSLTGGGSIVLGAQGNDYIFGATAATNTLTNVNNTISGLGNIGDGQLTLINQKAGVIDANQTGALTLQVNGGVTNAGLLEATGAGGLNIYDTGVTNTGGVIEATGAGAHVDLQGSTVAGGSLTSTAGAQIDLTNNQNATLDGSTAAGAVTVTKNSNVDVENNSALYLYGVIDNLGAITLSGTATATELRIGSTATPTTTLTGGGSVVLGAGGNDLIFASANAAQTLANVNNTISGTGNLGNGSLTFDNETNGVVDANQTGALTVQVNGGVTNTGLLEATGSGGLNIYDTGVTNTGGVIEATGANAHVDLQDSTVAGGSLTSTAGAQIDLTNSQNAVLDGSTSAGAVTIAAGSNVDVENNSALYLYGVIDNVGVITLSGTANATELRIGSTATPTTTLTGGGSIVLGAQGNDYIFASANASQTLANVNNTITGTGNLGNGSLTFDNEANGVVDANQTSALTLNVNGGVFNTGVLEATNSGGLFIVNTGVDNEGAGNTGKVEATGSGAHVDLQNASIYGGDITTGTGAFVDVVSGQIGYLYGQDPGDPLTITTGSNVDVNNNATLGLYGTIDNAGAINIEGTGNITALRIYTPVVTLSGGGTVNLIAGGDNYIYGQGGGADELVNVNNTIDGTGDVGNGQMTLDNEALGVIDGNQVGGLTLNPNEGVTNTGLIEATAGGGLLLLNVSVDDTQSNGTAVNAGKISATGAGSHVDLQNAYIYGGSITTGAGADVDVVSGQSAYLIGTYVSAPVVIAAGSNVNVNNNATLYLSGVIYNSGTINLGLPAEANATEIRINSPVVTLTTATPTVTGGVVQLSNASNNYIFAASNYSETLDNINNIIQGSGSLGNGELALINGSKGVIDANQAPNGAGEPGELILNPNGGVTNSGLIEATVAAGATAGGTLFILNTSVNNGTSGKIEALGATVNKVVLGGVVLLQNSTIYGGVITTTAKTPALVEVVSGQTAGLNGQASTLTLSGAVDVENNSTLDLAGVISNAKGVITLLGAANATYLTVTAATTTLTGAGTIDLAGTGNNDITSNNGVQTLINANNLIEGAGNIGDGGILVFVNQSPGVVNANLATAALTIQDGQTVENNGILESTAAGGLFILNSNIDDTYGTTAGVLNTGKLEATGTGHVDLQNSNIYGGTLSTTGAAYIDVVSGQSAGLNGTVQGQSVNILSGTNVDVNNNASLYIYGAIDNAGKITIEGAANATVIDLADSLVTLSGGGQLVLGGTGNNFIQEDQGNCELDNVNNTISGAGNIGNGGQMYLTNESAGTIDALAGGLTINLGGAEMTNAGTLEATGGALQVDDSVFNTGTIIAKGANVTITGGVDGAGTEEIFGAAELSIGSSTGGAAAQAVIFESGSTGVFAIQNAQDFTGAVTGLHTGDAIDLANINFASATIVSYAGGAASGVITVFDGTTVATITLDGDYTLANFKLVKDGSNHTEITYNGTGQAPKKPGLGVNPLSQMVEAMAALGGGASATAALPVGAQAAATPILARPLAA
jgi:hypothetical protein